MTTLQTYAPQTSGLSFEDRGQSLDLAYFIGIFRHRIFYFAIPFVTLLIIGVLIVVIQRPIFLAEGKILVESPEIPVELVRPTVTSAATERIQVIQQRLMSRDNLLAVVNKFGLFASQRQWMSGTQLLDLMRQRAQIQLVDIDSMLTSAGRPAPRINGAHSAVAFTVGFEYESADVAAKVANDFLTQILTEDARSRTDHASETTKFLAQEVKRLQEKMDVIDAQIFEAKRQATDPSKTGQDVPDALKAQMNILAAMKTDLLQKSSVYSPEHPAIKSLKKRIAALEQQISQTPKSDTAAPPAGQDVDALQQQQETVQRDLDDASKKLAAARLGESMERNQQSEHLQVIEQPSVPQKPVKPNRLKLLAMTLALAMAGGVGAIVLAEMLDKTIRGSRNISGVFDSHLVVSIPYISTVGEVVRNKRKIMILWTGLGISLLAGLAFALLVGVEVDFSWFDRSWIDSLTRLSK